MSYLASFSEQDPMPVFELSPAGRFIYINSATQRYFPDLESAGSGHKLVSGLADLVDKLKRGEWHVRELAVGKKWIWQGIYFIPESGNLRFYCQDVTSRRQSEIDTLRRSEEAVDLYDNAPCGYHSLDKDGLVVRINNTELKWLGYDRGEIVGKIKLVDLLTPESQGVLRKNFPVLKQTGHLNDLEVDFVRKDGAVLFTLLNASVVTDGDGNFLMTRTALVDITKRKQVELASAAIEANYRNLFEKSNDAIMVLDAEKFLECNAATLKMFRCQRPDQFIGHHPGQMSPPTQADGRDSIDAANDRIAVALKEGKDLFPWIHRRIDGTDFPAEVLLTPIEYKGQKVLQATVRDITERQLAAATLAESESRYRSLIDNSPDCIKLLDLDGRVVQANDGAMLEHGFKTKEEMIGWDCLSTFDAAYQPIIKKALADARLGRITQFDVKHTDHPVPGASKRSWSNMILVPVKDRDGRVVNIMATSRDISQNRELAERERSLEILKNKFIQVVSHQLRTPLSSVRWGLEELLAKKIGAISIAQEEMVRLAYEANNEVITRIGDLLLAMDIEEGHVRLEKEAVTVEEMVRSVCASLKPRFATAHIQNILVIPTEQRTEIQADAARIRDVFCRLMDNAVSYCGSGGTVTCRVTRDDGAVRVDVADTGIGIPRSELNHLFQRFHRASNASAAKPDSSGLGLYIAKNIIEAHGGRIGLESEEGIGSAFWFELPLAEAGGG